MDDKKYRNELKYVCSEAQLIQIENRVKTVCHPDPNVGKDGIYTIRSVYFDDYSNTCFYENENGTDPREKFRIRIYNGCLNRITLECKQKSNGLNHKDTCLLDWERCRSILDGSFAPGDTGTSSLLNRFYIQYRTRLLRAKVIVEYERTPYINQAGNVRITFDRHISSSDRVMDFGELSLVKRPVMPAGQHILEVKYDEFLPDYIYNTLQVKNLRRTPFSKYYYCRRFTNL